MQWTFGAGELVFCNKPPATIFFANLAANASGFIGSLYRSHGCERGNTILVLGRVLERPGSGSLGSLIARFTLRVIRFPPWTLF
ncbi:hypothetical protein CEE69_19645 [Rhodopirellula bahusiensis]|uniref:Uncharacterized protein n=1 Tax=Rhodopirellula bahusiensis TaxID=2014065 RepID=A0A2G1W3A1_9BACT|nr:hypothetical protein CEE69_19645 [Rhodopirellula bahusiensis]